MSRVVLQAPRSGTAAAPTRASENVIVGDEVVRHRFAARVIHWSVALTFFLLLFTGMPIWSPIFGWMAALFGGLEVCRWLHPWVGVAFSVFSILMFVSWLGDMRLEKQDRAWLGPKVFEYLKFQGEDPEVGKYNGGQKLFFFAISLATLGLLVTGIVLWIPMSFSRGLAEAAIILHDIAFILSAMLIVAHIYLATAAEPGTFRAMTRGTVEKAWARVHHPRWYREVTGEERRR
jgi:formate dehydrogenase subunit gamma